MGVKGVGLQLGGKTVGGTGLNTVQIVQGGGQKQVTMQQIQHVLKVPQQTIQHITQVCEFVSEILEFHFIEPTFLEDLRYPLFECRVS